jgi:hypothetical protein
MAVSALKLTDNQPHYSIVKMLWGGVKRRLRTSTLQPELLQSVRHGNMSALNEARSYSISSYAQ